MVLPESALRLAGSTYDLSLRLAQALRQRYSVVSLELVERAYMKTEEISNLRLPRGQIRKRKNRGGLIHRKGKRKGEELKI